MDANKDNIFKRNRKKTLAAVILVVSLAMVVSTEILLQKVMGLGDPVIYDVNPAYGYRPLPNRSYRRFGGARLEFNNLGLRAEIDFDASPAGKILFLGDSVTYGGSRIDNADLFSRLAVAEMEGFTSGNAAVNAWGVENIYGLVVESEFRPAQIYVTVVSEGDFYRGLAQIIRSHLERNLTD